MLADVWINLQVRGSWYIVVSMAHTRKILWVHTWLFATKTRINSCMGPMSLAMAMFVGKTTLGLCAQHMLERRRTRPKGNKAKRQYGHRKMSLRLYQRSATAIFQVTRVRIIHLKCIGWLKRWFAPGEYCNVYCRLLNLIHKKFCPFLIVAGISVVDPIAIIAFWQ